MKPHKLDLKETPLNDAYLQALTTHSTDIEILSAKIDWYKDQIEQAKYKLLKALQDDACSRLSDVQEWKKIDFAWIVTALTQHIVDSKVSDIEIIVWNTLFPNKFNFLLKGKSFWTLPEFLVYEWIDKDDINYLKIVWLLDYISRLPYLAMEDPKLDYFYKQNNANSLLDDDRCEKEYWLANRNYLIELIEKLT